MSTSPSGLRSSRREFLTVTAAAAASTLGTASCAPAQTGEARAASPAQSQTLVGDGRKRRILLRGGVVLTLDAKIGDFENADVLIDGTRIAEVRPGIAVG